MVGAIAGVASATPYRFDWDGVTAGGISNAAGKVNTIKIEYDTVSQAYSFESTIKKHGGRLADGFWLVTSAGPDPKGIVNELPIFYFDGSGATPTLSVFNYNGQNNSNSWQNPGQLIAKFTGSAVSKINVDANTRTFKFNIPGAAINSFVPPTGDPTQWDGLKFGSKLGLWYHPVDDLTTNYSNNGTLNRFDYSTQGWVDGSNYTTEIVPEPATMLALAAGIAAMARKRRNK